MRRIAKRRLVEIIQQVRELDLKKPPSIAESIDWARALLLLGAERDSGQATFRETMSVIVKHRTDLDTVAERVGCPSSPMPAPTPRKGQNLFGGTREQRPGGVRRQVAGVRRGAAGGRSRDRHLGAARRVRGAGPCLVDGADRLPRDARRNARQVPRGSSRVRAGVRSVLLPRRRGGGDAKGGHRGGREAMATAPRSTSTRCVSRSRSAPGRSDAAMRDLARLAIAAFSARRGLGRTRCRRPTDPPAWGCAQSPSQSSRTTTPASRSQARSVKAFRAAPAARARA